MLKQKSFIFHLIRINFTFKIEIYNSHGREASDLTLASNL